MPELCAGIEGMLMTASRTGRRQTLAWAPAWLALPARAMKAVGSHQRILATMVLD